MNEKDESEEIANKENMHSAANSAKADKDQQFSNPTALLKLRLTKWEQQNREKKHLMDLYMRNTRVVEDAFQQISEATGISSISEIVTTFIKTEE